MSHSDPGAERRRFEAALQLEGDARQAFLDEVEQENEGHAKRLRALLAAHALPGLDSTPAAMPASLGTVLEPRSWSEVSTSRGRVPAVLSRHEAVSRPTRGVRTSQAKRSVSGRLPPGSVLQDRYRIAARIGKGGMGEVYRAHDETLGEDIAVKLFPDGSGDPGRLSLLLSEVRIARQVSHPNVCRVHDVAEADGLRFMTMELVEGEDLARLLSRSGPLPIERAAYLGAQLCDGLDAMHTKGILHRDLKPANVLIDRSGEARLADFGLAGLVGVDIPGGTPTYMAPELWTDAGASVQSELYALGMVLYELFTGTSLFAGGSGPEIGRQHWEDLPASPIERRAEVPAAVAETILRCLEKDPSARPLSAASVAAVLRGDAIPDAIGRSVQLRAWQPPPLPSEPFPVLLPYRHRDLLASRDAEIARLVAWLALPRPIIGVAAASGTGKTSLLAGGVYPALRGADRPAVLERDPSQPGIAGRLVGGLLDAYGGIALADSDHDGFVALLEQAASLAGGEPPVLIVDQVEDLFRHPDARRARAVLGGLLAATCLRRPGLDGPPCRWLLAFREEYAGALDAWLRDVRSDAEALGFSTSELGAADGSFAPLDLSTPDRFQAWSLTPLGTPSSAAGDPLVESTAIFRRVIEVPITLVDEAGARRYPWRFAGDGVERLARAFAEARLAEPDAPLVPEFQVVLAHLLDRAGPPARDGCRVVAVPDDVGRLIDRALEDHLRRALEMTFPGGRGASQGRARALLALRELATASGTRDAGLPAAALERAIGSDGPRVLAALAGPAMRLVVSNRGPEERQYRLAHDRLAEAVARLVEEEGRGGGLLIDSDLLALRRQIGLQSALHAAGEADATVIPRQLFRRVAAHADALLFDDDRRVWWAACQQRRRAIGRRRAVWAVLLAVVVALAGYGFHRETERRTARAALLERVTSGEPESAIRALTEALDAPALGIERDALTAALGAREKPLDVLELGMGALPRSRLGDAVLAIGELALPLVAPDAERLDEQSVHLASLLWALDFAAMRVPALASRAQSLRDRALAPLWAAHPPPDPGDEAGGHVWVDLPGGTFWMGAGPGEERENADSEGEYPRHEVKISAFQMLAREVTYADYRRLVPDHPGPDGRASDGPEGTADQDLPVTRIRWYDAVVYAAWLGGPGGSTRLPTEAEWEYAARAGCAGIWCGPDGDALALDAVAWWVGNAVDVDGANRTRPVATLAPNPYGVHDLFGNVWEWVSSWYRGYPYAESRDPLGPPVGEEVRYRSLRGGSVFVDAAWLYPSARGATSPERAAKSVGMRPVRARAGGGT